MTKLQQPLKWYGGKHYLAKKIVELMPEHLHYVEPYFGGGSVLLEKNPDGISEVVNDIHPELTVFWRVLQDEELFKRFQRWITAVPFSEREWEDSYPISGDDMVATAVNFFVRCRQSRTGQFKDFATLSRNRIRRRMNEQASAWMNAVEGLPEVVARLKRVVILNRDAVEVIRQQDGVNTLFYLDPPYLHETRSSSSDFLHEMTPEQHETLLETLRCCQGKVILSGYPSKLYETMLHDWRYVDFAIDNKVSGAKRKRQMTERVWMNYETNC